MSSDQPIDRELDWDNAIATPSDGATDYLVPLSGTGDVIWEEEWQRALVARQQAWKRLGMERIDVTAKPSDLKIERVPIEHDQTVREDIDAAVEQANGVPRA